MRVFIWHCLLIFFTSKQSLEHVRSQVSQWVASSEWNKRSLNPTLTLNPNYLVWFFVIKCFTLKLVRDIIKTYSQMHRIDNSSQHSSIIWPVGLNGWVFVYERNGCGFQSCCCHLNHWQKFLKKLSTLPQYIYYRRKKISI